MSKDIAPSQRYTNNAATKLRTVGIVLADQLRDLGILKEVKTVDVYYGRSTLLVLNRKLPRRQNPHEIFIPRVDASTPALESVMRHTEEIAERIRIIACSPGTRLSEDFLRQLGIQTREPIASFNPSQVRR